MGVKIVELGENTGEFVFWCPARKISHSIRTKHGPWTFNGNKEKPTIKNSIKVTWGNQAGDRICHSWVTNGMIKYEGDCTHEFKNQTIELPDYPL